MTLEEAMKILGLEGSPSPQEVKNAFRRLALKYHPDKNPDPVSALPKFRLCVEAYEFLVTQTAIASFSAQPETIENLDDIFGDIFGFTTADRVLGYRTPQEIDLTLEEIAFLKHKKLKLVSYVPCESCQGRGAKPHGRSSLCTYCFGSGCLTQEGSHKLCPRCVGRGRLIEKACSSCGGYGTQKKKALFDLPILAGWQPGETYTFQAPSLSGIKATLYLTVSLKPHFFYHYSQRQLECHYGIDRQIMEQGGVVDVPTLWGWASLTVPKKTEEGSRLVLKQAGLWMNPQGQKGDVVVWVHGMEAPFAIRQQKKLVKQWSKVNPHYPCRKSWWPFWS